MKRVAVLVSGGGTNLQALLESEFYRKISTDMRDGLRRIYREMNEARSAGSEEALLSDKAVADKLAGKK